MHRLVGRKDPKRMSLQHPSVLLNLTITVTDHKTSDVFAAAPNNSPSGSGEWRHTPLLFGLARESDVVLYSTISSGEKRFKQGKENQSSRTLPEKL